MVSAKYLKFFSVNVTHPLNSCINRPKYSLFQWISMYTPLQYIGFDRNQINLLISLLFSYIYAVGGRDDCMELSSAERYNPHTNTWSPIVAMTSRRSGVSKFIQKHTGVRQFLPFKI